MSPVPRKIVVNERGEPLEVIVPWESFCEIAEAFGWDLGPEALEDLRAKRRDFQESKQIEKSIASTRDDTAYLLGTEANRRHLEAALNDVKAGRNLSELPFQELEELK